MSGGIAIGNGRIVDPANGVDTIADLFVVDGRIVTGAPPAGFAPERRIDATGCLVLPGLVDLAARLREPGEEHKATVASEARAAAAAGITTLICPPDTDPPIDTPAEVELITRLARAAGGAFVHPLGALTRRLEGRQLAEMAALREAGAIGVSQALAPVADHLLLRRALEYAASQRLTVHLHPIDFALAGRGCAHEGRVATRLGLTGIPAAAETAALGLMLALAEETGARLHFCRLSTARAVELIARARADGLPVTADVAAHQLFLTEVDIVGFAADCHVIPPLRTERDRDGLRQGVADGVVAAICSDHQPHEADAKLGPFPATRPGISALETLLPLTLKLAGEGVVDLATAIASVTTGPAAIAGLDAGTLGDGRRADITIVDPHAVWQPRPEEWRSSGRNTPFFGWEFSGRVTHTIVAGRVVSG